MEEPEVPLEGAQEHIEHRAHESGVRWTSWVAMSTAILAACAAVASLLAGDNANEAMIEQMRASDQWAYYQAKGIKEGVIASKIELLKAGGYPVSPADQEKIAQYAEDQKTIKETGDEKEKEAEAHLTRHVILARSVTMFQIAIAIGAISALTLRKRYWFLSLGFGVAGLACLCTGLAEHLAHWLSGR